MKVFKKSISLLIALISVLSMFTITAFAAVPVHQIDTARKGSIEFYKYEMEDVSTATNEGNGEYTDNIPVGATPLADVEFTIYKISDITDYYLTDGAKLPTVSEAKDAINENTASKSAYTDTNGYIKFDNLDLGIYYCEETYSPSQVRKATAPFVVSVPTTDISGTKWLYDVTVQPKNETKYADVTLFKIDGNTAEALENFDFMLEEEIIAKDGSSKWQQVGGTFTTGADGKFVVTHLATARNYRFTEIKVAAPGYILDNTGPYYFTVNADGTVTYDGDTVEENLIKITNEIPKVSKEVSTDKAQWYQDVTQFIGKSVYWKIDTDIPRVIEKMSVYTIVDTLSKGCTYNSLEVFADGVKLSTDDYSVTADNSSEEATVITVDITNKQALSGSTLCTVILDTTLNDKAVIGADNPNTAKLVYTNNIGTNSTYEQITSTPEVHTGGYQFMKRDESGNGLANAKFKVYATKTDADNDENAITFINSDGQYVTEAISDSNGLVSILGLAYGENGMDSSSGFTHYYISEIEAPDGYALLKEPFEITVTATSHNYVEGISADVINTLKTIFPVTGSVAGITLAVSGSLIAGVGIILFFKKSKKKEVK